MSVRGLAHNAALDSNNSGVEDVPAVLEHFNNSPLPSPRNSPRHGSPRTLSFVASVEGLPSHWNEQPEQFRPTEWKDSLQHFRERKDAATSISLTEFNPQLSSKWDLRLDYNHDRPPTPPFYKESPCCVHLDYKDKPTELNGFWHWGTSFRPCSQLFDISRDSRNTVLSPRLRVTHDSAFQYSESL